MNKKDAEHIAVFYEGQDDLMIFWQSRWLVSAIIQNHLLIFIF